MTGICLLLSMASISAPVFSLSGTNPTMCGAADGSITLTGNASGDLVILDSMNTVLYTENSIILPYNFPDIPAGTYIITLTDSTGTATESITLEDPQVPTAPTVTATNFCGYSEVVFSGLPGASFTWNTGDSTDTIITTSPGLFAAAQTLNGCTSAPSTVIASPQVAFIFQTDTVLSAFVAGDSYQWIDCDNGNALIPGATDQNFTPTSNGNYAVIVSWSNCIDTSECTAINTLTLPELESSAVSVYPNPAVEYLTVKSVDPIWGYQLVDATGKMLQEQSFSSSFHQIQIYLDDLESGLCFLKLQQKHDHQSIIVPVIIE